MKLLGRAPSYAPYPSSLLSSDGGGWGWGWDDVLRRPPQSFVSLRERSYSPPSLSPSPPVAEQQEGFVVEDLAFVEMDSHNGFLFFYRFSSRHAARLALL